MTKKKIKKKVKKEETTQKVSKKIKEKENRQLLWFFFWIAIAFGAFLTTYFYGQAQNNFTHGTIEWTIEAYENLEIYHGRFKVLNGQDITFNIYHRLDPRTNNEVIIEGNLSDFKYGSYLSFTPELDACRGEVSRAIVDISSYLKTGVGTQIIEVATTEETQATATKPYITCENTQDRTIIILDKGTESSIIKHKKNPSCYTITVADCNDIAPIEKFITQSVEDFRGTHG